MCTFYHAEWLQKRIHSSKQDRNLMESNGKKRDYNNAESSDLNIQEQKYIHN